MKLTAKSSTTNFDPFTIAGSRPQAEAIIILSAFEHELDALLSFMDEDRNPAVSEAIIRRFVTAEEIYEEIIDATKRIDIKFRMVGSRMTGSGET